MNRQPYDYSGFSLRRLNEPRFAHAKLLGGWIGYFILYFITENLIPASRCHPIHCALDDLIPFNEAFLFFYVGWYVLVVWECQLTKENRSATLLALSRRLSQIFLEAKEVKLYSDQEEEVMPIAAEPQEDYGK